MPRSNCSGRHQTQGWPNASADAEGSVAHGRDADGDTDNSAGDGEGNGSSGRTENVALIVAAPLSVWGRLDRHSAWQVCVGEQVDACVRAVAGV